MCFEEQPDTEPRDDAAKDRAFLRRDSLRQRGCDTETANIAARRDECHVKQCRQHHSQNGAGKVNAPLVNLDDAPPATPTLE